MALVLKDRVQELGTANTTVSFTLSGAVTGFQAFTAIGNGNVTFYTATDSAGNWEVGVGTYSTTGPTLTRTTILASSNSGSAVTFSGTVNVFVTYPAEKSINYDVNGVATIGETLGYSDTGIIGSFASTEAGYNQVIVQNKSNATNASANINISNNVSTSTTGFAELGINSSTFSGTGSFSIPSAAYLASAGTDLTIGTYNANDIHFVTNSNTTDAMVIHDDGGIALGGLSDPGIGNIACNNINLKFEQVVTAGGTTTLTNASPYMTQFTGTTTQTVQLPDATTCLVGTTFIFDNDSTGSITVKDGAGVSFETVISGGIHNFVLEDNSTVAGTWLRYSLVPSEVEWGTNSLQLGPTVITGGVWNGGTIPTGYGGTGLSTFGAANYALYSTNASTLVAGVLPVAAGGTGASTAFTSGSVIFAGTSGTYSQDNANFFWDDTNNRLGIGTSSPTADLEVKGTGGGRGDIYINTAQADGNQTVGTLAFLGGASSTVEPRVAYVGAQASGTTSGNRGGVLFFATKVDGASTLTERMRIDSAGNVGIGNNNPTSRLEVVTTSGTSSLKVWSATNTSPIADLELQRGTNATWGADAYGDYRLRNDTGNLLFQYGESSTTTERMRITSGGQVGINTTTPDTSYSKLTIAGTGGTASVVLERTNTGLGGTKGFIGFKSVNGYYTATISEITGGSSDDTGNLVFGTMASSTVTNPYSVTERMRIDSSGNVGIGVTSPVTSLDVRGTATTSGASQRTIYTADTSALAADNGGGIAFGGVITAGGTIATYGSINAGKDNATSSNQAGYLKFVTNNNTALVERMRIDSSGNVQIGTTAAILGGYTGSNPILTLASNTATPVTQAMYTANANGAIYQMVKGRGTIASPTATTTSDLLGALSFAGYNTSNTIALGAYINAKQENTGGATYIPAYMSFYTGTNAVAPLERMRIDSSGNVGLGVTPSAWGSTYRAYQTLGGALYSNTTGLGTVQNAYKDASNIWTYSTTAASTLYETTGGQHKWFNAPSGTAGTAITFTQAMTLDNSGNLGIDVTPSAYGSSYKGLDLSTFTGLMSSSTGAYFTGNVYYNGSNWIYKTSTAGAMMAIGSTGATTWYSFPSGTAGATATYTPNMTLDVNGNLGIGTTNPGALLDVDGTSRVGVFTKQSSSVSVSSANLALGNFGVLSLPATSAYGGIVRLYAQRGANDATGVQKILAEFRVSKSGNTTGANSYFYVTSAQVDTSNIVTYQWYFDSTTGVAALKFVQSSNSWTYYVEFEANYSAAITVAMTTTTPSGTAIYPTYTQTNFTTPSSGYAIDIGSTTNAFVINSSGNVGIGATPSTILFVSAPSPTAIPPTISLENSTNYDSSNFTNYRTDFVFRGDKQNRYTGSGAILGPLASVSTVYSNTTFTSDSEQGAGALVFSTRAGTATTSSDTLTERMRIDSSGNVGIGVSPLSWNTAYKSIQIGQQGALSAGTGNNLIGISSNSQWITGGTYNYITTSQATQYQQYNGTHFWNIAPSGTAGTAITFTQAMTLDASGNLGLGATPSAWFTNWTALETVSGAVVTYDTSDPTVIISSNAYISGGSSVTTSAYKIASKFASMYRQSSGTHAWFTAPATGTVGSAISWTQAMTLDASGNLGIGDTNPSYKLTVADTGTDHQLWVRNTGTAASDDAIILIQTAGTGTTSTISGLYFGDGDSSSIGRLNYNHTNDSMAFFTNSTEKMRITSAGGISFGSSGTAYGSSGQVLTSNGNAAPTWGSALVSGTVTATTSGTSVTYSGLPSWIKRITIGFNGVSFATTAAALRIRVAYSGGTVTTGYKGNTTQNGTSVLQISAGFDMIATYPVANAVYGTMTLILMDSSTNTWAAQLNLYEQTTNSVYTCGGTVALAGALTGVIITSVAGTSSFDAGSVNILYE